MALQCLVLHVRQSSGEDKGAVMVHLKFKALLLAVILFSATCFSAKAQQPDDGFILLSGGTYSMGSPGSERQRQPDEVQHDVRISPFYVDPFEVSQKDFEALMGNNPSAHMGNRLPVENVTWLDAVRYCNALSASRGLEPAYVVDGEAVRWNRRSNGYRLLTEAEWEYAARAGTSTVFNVGSQVHSDVVNFQANYPYLIEENYVTQRDPDVEPSHFRGETMEVKSLQPNGFGLYHTHGNVSEWVFDYYGSYGDLPANNPSGHATGALRVCRGGSFIDFGKHLRCSYRSARNPIDADPKLGFRICRNAKPMDADVFTSAPIRFSAPAPSRILVAYYSYSGNTRRAAEIISEKLDADVFEIVMETPYGGNIYDVSQKDLNMGFRPPLAKDVSIDDYDVILLGYPTWWGTLPMPVLSFMEAHDWKGKIVIPFNSHGSTFFGESVSDLAKSSLGAYVGIGVEFTYSGGRHLRDRLVQWLKSSDLLK